MLLFKDGELKATKVGATTKSNMGAITFTAKLGSYQYDSSTVNTHGWSNANKDFSLASITTRTRSDKNNNTITITISTVLVIVTTKTKTVTRQESKNQD